MRQTGSRGYEMTILSRSRRKLSALLSVLLAFAAAVPHPANAQSDRGLLMAGTAYTSLSSSLAQFKTKPNCISYSEAVEGVRASYAMCFFEMEKADDVILALPDGWVIAQIHGILTPTSSNSPFKAVEEFEYGVIQKDFLQTAASPEGIFNMIEVPRFNGNVDAKWLSKSLKSGAVTTDGEGHLRLASALGVYEYLAFIVDEIETMRLFSSPDDRCKYAFWSKVVSLSQERREAILSCSWYP